MKKTLFSNFDVFIITKELNNLLTNGRIDKVYEVEDLIIIKINTNQGKQNLIIKKDARINLTHYDYPIPNFPSQYILSLRKLLKNRRIISIFQYKFDRIIIFELSNPDGNPWKLIIELFNKGNYIVVNENNIVKIARKYRKYRDRDILANREYVFPKSRGADFLSIKEEIKDLIKNSDTELVRALARNVNISGFLSEEIILTANLDKKKPANSLNDEELDALYNSFKKIRNLVLFGEIEAYIVYDENGNEIAAVPFEFVVFKNNPKKKFNSFNEAVDTFFSKIDSEVILTPKDSRVNAQIKSQEKILKNQLEYLETLKKKKTQYYKQGDFIYANFQNLEKLLMVIKDARAKGYNWEEINNKLLNAKSNHLEGTEFFVKIIAATKKLVININDSEVFLDLNKSIGENANIIYSRGKKAEKKIKGTEVAKERTLKKIKELQLEKEAIEAEVDYLIRKPKKKWYEKFRWFNSSDGFLVIGGRDASSNELIYKKYLEQNDIVLHTTFPGSPLAVIKNPDNLEIPERTISEAADFVASYSRAWKEDWGVVEIFHIRPDQVSKNPPTGEYLPKGSFMISGKKNFIKNAKTELTVGLKLSESSEKSEENENIIYPNLICGPSQAIKKQVEIFLIIKPSKSGLTKGKLAKEIKNYFLRKVDHHMKKWVKLISLDDIILCLPNGNSLIVKNKKTNNLG
ncbi:MAG: ribosome rescue protein RqcH [Promethearchaeota archaeon]